MGAAKFAISVDAALLKRLDRLVAKGLFPNRSRAFQTAMKEKIEQLEKGRLAAECAKLDIKSERAMADDLTTDELDSWPKY